jgi:hypothetical protein
MRLNYIKFIGYILFALIIAAPAAIAQMLPQAGTWWYTETARPVNAAMAVI